MTSAVNPMQLPTGARHSGCPPRGRCRCIWIWVRGPTSRERPTIQVRARLRNGWHLWEPLAPLLAGRECLGDGDPLGRCPTCSWRWRPRDQPAPPERCRSPGRSGIRPSSFGADNLGQRRRRITRETSSPLVLLENRGSRFAAVSTRVRSRVGRLRRSSGPLGRARRDDVARACVWAEGRGRAWPAPGLAGAPASSPAWRRILDSLKTPDASREPLDTAASRALGPR